MGLCHSRTLSTAPTRPDAMLLLYREKEGAKASALVPSFVMIHYSLPFFTFMLIGRKNRFPWFRFRYISGGDKYIHQAGKGVHIGITSMQVSSKMQRIIEATHRPKCDQYILFTRKKPEHTGSGLFVATRRSLFKNIRPVVLRYRLSVGLLNVFPL